MHVVANPNLPGREVRFFQSVIADGVSAQVAVRLSDFHRLLLVLRREGLSSGSGLLLMVIVCHD